MTADYTPSTDDVRKAYPANRKMPRTADERFWGRVEKSEACWEWIGRKDRDGYGVFSMGRDNVRAHRWFYERFVAAIPAGLVMDHLCRDRACVNPCHLEPVTNHENLLRGEGVAARSASRTSCPRLHEYALRGDGTRYCPTCHRERERIRRATGSTMWTCWTCGRTVANKSQHLKIHGGS